MRKVVKFFVYSRKYNSIIILLTSGKMYTRQMGYVAHGIPTHPLLLHWTMLHRCALIHPTVMFRKQAVLDSGGYMNDLDSNNSYDTESSGGIFQKYVEDYNLWLRILERFVH